MINVLTFVNDLPNEGGVGSVVYSLNKEFNSKNIINNQVISIRFYDSLPLRLIKIIRHKPILKKKKYNFDNVEVIFLKNTLLDKLVDNVMIKNFKKKSYINQLIKYIDITHFDIIHGHFYSTVGYYTHELAKKYNKKSIITFHGSDTINLNKQDELVINSFDAATFVSDFLKRTIEDKINLNVTKKVIYNGVDDNIFNLKNMNSERNVIAYCGRLHPIKGVDTLKIIFTELYKKLPNAEFHIYGDGVKREELESFFIANNVPIVFYGMLGSEKLAKKMENVKILVMPSEREGFPCIIQEAKSCGVYVIATKVGGVPEAIGNIGTLINRDEEFVKNIINEVYKVWNSPYSPSEIAEDHILSWENIAKEYQELYIKIKGDEL